MSLQSIVSLTPCGADLRALPARILIVPWGEVDTNQGRVICNAVTLDVLPRVQAKIKRERIALDFQHNTVEGTKFYQGEPAKVAAYGNIEPVANAGVFLTNIEYTPEGKNILPGGHYPDISPAVLRDERGVVIGLHSVGAVRQGEIDGLTLFSAPSFAAAVDEVTKTKKDKTMDYKKIIVALLGLTDAATDDEIQKAADAFAKKVETKAATPAPEPKPAADGDQVAALSAEFGSLRDKINIIIADGEKVRRDALVARAAADGKVIPLSAETLAATPLTVLEDMVKQLQVTVPVDKRTPGAVTPFAASVTDGGAADQVRAQLGISKEQWDKVNK